MDKNNRKREVFHLAKRGERDFVRLYSEFWENSLSRIGYTVTSKEMGCKKGSHIILVGISIAVFILSFISAKQIGFYVFAFHIANLTYKNIVAYYKMWNFEKKIHKQRSTTTARLGLTPLSLEFYVLCFLNVLMVVVFIIFGLTYKSIEMQPRSFYSLMVYTSIFVSCILDCFDGLKSIYMVEVDERRYINS